MGDESDGEWIAVTETWGQETFTPVPYNTFVVGPFSVTARLQLPQKPGAATVIRAKLRQELRVQAEGERERKATSFLAMLKRMGLLGA